MVNPQAPSTTVTPTRLALFGPPPLLEGEDATAYDELLARVSGAVKPADILEEVWVRDVGDLVWEILRLRRLKTSLLTANVHKGLERILEPFMAWPAANDLAKRWAAGNQPATEEVDTLLASAGLTMEAVMAQTLSVKIDDIERIDRMIMNAEGRRNASLREVDRHRASLAQALRRVSEEIEEGQFTVVDAKQIAIGT